MRSGQRSRVSRVLLTGSTSGSPICKYTKLGLDGDWAKDTRRCEKLAERWANIQGRIRQYTGFVLDRDVFTLPSLVRTVETVYL